LNRNRGRIGARLSEQKVIGRIADLRLNTARVVIFMCDVDLALGAEEIFFAEHFELFDLDINAGANLLQNFVLDALKLDGTLIFENDQTFDFKVGDDLPIIRNASTLDGPD